MDLFVCLPGVMRYQAVALFAGDRAVLLPRVGHNEGVTRAWLVAAVLISMMVVGCRSTTVAVFWADVLGAISSYLERETPLVNAVERLIDLVARPETT
jgi:hypothetical protein